MYINEETTKHTCEQLLEKSQESFILAIEIFNKPTIKYRVEGCAFFLCNAWELMLKSAIIKKSGYSAIFYPNKTNRTLSLEDCVKKVMTNEKDPVRKNIETLCELRNTSTHFIVSEYEIPYTPIFQASIQNFDERLRKYHGIEISDKIPDNYLVLSTRKTDLDEETIRARYYPETAERLLKIQADINTISNQQTTPKYAAVFRTEFVISKQSGIPIQVDNSSTTKAKIVKEIKPTDKYSCRMSDVINMVNGQLRKRNIELFNSDNSTIAFNKYHFGLFCKVYNLKADKKYTYDRSLKTEKNHYYVYSQKIVEFIVEIIAKNPGHIIEQLKNKSKKL